MTAPNHVHPNQNRELADGERYWMRGDGHVVPRGLSLYEAPSKEGGWSPIIVVDGQVKRDDEPLPDPSTVADASEIQGNQVSADRGHVTRNSRRMARAHVSNPNALDDHQVRERIEAKAPPKPQEKTPPPAGGKQRRKQGGGDLSGLAGG